tara:strand:- start:434 stop:646 length:213 start_codon:yes stop_codon:yes gene_type:complete
MSVTGDWLRRKMLEDRDFIVAHDRRWVVALDQSIVAHDRSLGNVLSTIREKEFSPEAEPVIAFVIAGVFQ